MVLTKCPTNSYTIFDKLNYIKKNWKIYRVSKNEILIIDIELQNYLAKIMSLLAPHGNLLPHYRHF